MRTPIEPGDGRGRMQVPPSVRSQLMDGHRGMATPAVFFSRCYPQDCDAIEIVLRERRVFIGYPAFRTGVVPDRHRLRDSVVDPWISDEEWSGLRQRVEQPRREYQQNRNFVREIQPGAIALVPRASKGVVYAGWVLRPFELLDDPPWADDYLRVRKEQGRSVENVPHLLADVAQCWEVDRFRPIPYPVIPAWMRRSLFGRSTYGRIRSAPFDGADPHAELDRLLENPTRAVPPWTDNAREVERRLIDGIGPGAFEHLCVALLQLEHPESVWAHVGGAGDGGVDGIGADERGNVVGLLQCKWAYWNDDPFTGVDLAHGQRCILAALLHPEAPPMQGGVEFWSRDRIAALVLKHANRLPLAASLRIRP